MFGFNFKIYNFFFESIFLLSIKSFFLRIKSKPILLISCSVLDRSTYYLSEDYHQDYYKLDTRVLKRFGYRKQSDVYQLYRDACGRDQRVRELWGDAAAFVK